MVEAFFRFMLENKLFGAAVVVVFCLLVSVFLLPGYLWPTAFIVTVIGGCAGYGTSFRWPLEHGWKWILFALIVSLAAYFWLEANASPDHPWMFKVMYGALGVSSFCLFYFLSNGADHIAGGGNLAGGGNDGDGDKR